MLNELRALQDACLEVANDAELTQSGAAIEQKQRNKIKRLLTDAMETALREVADANPSLSLYRVKGGLMLAISNVSIGVIPVEVEISVKNLAVNPAEEEARYKNDLALQTAKRERQEAAKAAKMAITAEERELKRKLREAKLARFAVRKEED